MKKSYLNISTLSSFNCFNCQAAVLNGMKTLDHTGQCKRTGGCYNELVVAFFSTGGGVKGEKNLYLLTF